LTERLEALKGSALHGHFTFEYDDFLRQVSERIRAGASHTWAACHEASSYQGTERWDYNLIHSKKRSSSEEEVG
jgi:hypothetical protein